LLRITLQYDDTPPIQRRGAAHTLKVASAMLKLLNALDCDLSGKRKPLFVWDVNIYSFNDRAVIEMEPLFPVLHEPDMAAFQERLIGAMSKGVGE